MLERASSERDVSIDNPSNPCYSFVRYTVVQLCLTSDPGLRPQSLLKLVDSASDEIPLH